MSLALAAGEKACDRRGPSGWLVEERFTQADITVACIGTFLSESLQIFDHATRYQGLRSHNGQCEALPDFVDTHSRWFMADMQQKA
jgi:glutathione S-transferase